MKRLSQKQKLSIAQSDAPINIWWGAVRSGKTYASLVRFLMEVADGPEGEYCIVARTYDSIKRNLVSQISQLIGADARYYSGKREMHIWGKTINLVGADDERSEAKIRGATFSGAYCDEGSILPESVFKMLISRCAMNNGKIFVTTNPDSPFHWLKRDYLTDNKDVKDWHFILDDNPELSDVSKEYLKRQYKGIWSKRFIEGLWVQAEGAIYDMFGEDCLIDYPGHLAHYYILGIDYGTTNPCAFVLIGVNLERFPAIWVEDEYYFDSKIQQRQKTDSEYMDDLVKFINNRHVTTIYLDPSAVSFRVELRRNGFNNVLEAKNEVLDGTRFVGKYLSNGRMKVCRKCKNLIKEFHSYVWDTKSIKTGVDKPLKENDHALDALRYAIYSHFFGRDGDVLSADDIERNWRETRGGNQANLPSFFQNPIEGYRPF